MKPTNMGNNKVLSKDYHMDHDDDDGDDDAHGDPSSIVKLDLDNSVV